MHNAHFKENLFSVNVNHKGAKRLLYDREMMCFRKPTTFRSVQYRDPFHEDQPRLDLRNLRSDIC